MESAANEIGHTFQRYFIFQADFQIQSISSRQSAANRALQLQDSFWFAKKRTESEKFLKLLMKKKTDVQGQHQTLRESFFEFNVNNMPAEAFIQMARQLWLNSRQPHPVSRLNPLQKLDQQIAQLLYSKASILTMFYSSRIPGMCSLKSLIRSAGTRKVQGLIQKLDNIEKSINTLYDKRNKVEELPRGWLDDRTSSFWTRDFLGPDTQFPIVNAFCLWQRAIQESQLLNQDLLNIKQHSKDDIRTLDMALSLEKRAFAKSLISKRITVLLEKVQFLDENLI
jgi:hypothetical protein